MKQVKLGKKISNLYKGTGDGDVTSSRDNVVTLDRELSVSHIRDYWSTNLYTDLYNLRVELARNTFSPITVPTEDLVRKACQVSLIWPD